MSEIEFLSNTNIPVVYRILYLKLSEEEKQEVLKLAEKEYGEINGLVL